MSDKTFAGEVGNYKAPAHESHTKQGSMMNDGDAAGINSGCSEITGFDSEFDVGPVINYAINPVNGNANQRYSENPQVSTVGDPDHPGAGKFTLR